MAHPTGPRRQVNTVLLISGIMLGLVGLVALILAVLMPTFIGFGLIVALPTGLIGLLLSGVGVVLLIRGLAAPPKPHPTPWHPPHGHTPPPNGPTHPTYAQPPTQQPPGPAQPPPQPPPS
ncbi:hypothetical protein J4H86_22655 [Spiractinospora alimapuensis]|uniref:hypothetical protein n=1 Tax=Spiractinospora alimapuensis TaxID=2820884 RepID=UPI001F168802|nr:hypothetical protein [Spiractinospora alimapuensis]QVQ51559.1 hypothetical protein J4H86_22655 [Spiractinospora alimapuensis]